ncbi:ATP-binding protein [uncultured Brevundimonas sp.]|uniref:ATP-binding protein n=1 Tax=uncultured Brevundimonas sp. TaxID=213418 RepID=UPI0030ED752D|tara:strand:- start:210 stop:1547 length:1338 start_codon:yes stop_codon:yes gene_type:complete
MTSAFDTFASRIFLVLLGGVMIAAAAALIVSDATHRSNLAHLHVFNAAERAGDLAANAINSGQTPSAVTTTGVGVGHNDLELARAVAAALDRRGLDGIRVAAYEVSSGACDANWPHRNSTDRSAPRCRLLTLTVAGGSREESRIIPLTVSLPAGPTPLAADSVGLSFMIAMLLITVLTAWLASRLASGPLNRLSAAAVALGEDIDNPPLKEEGTREVREAAMAFNAMQRRLKVMLHERTRMLAAIAHDLQTPLTRLRLRIEKVADSELRARLIGDLTATQILVREGLDLARAGESVEPWARLDLDTMIMALCEDAADAGQPVRFGGGDGRVVRARPNALKRCLANLVDNAVIHGGAALVRCGVNEAGVPCITVTDSGPGVPEGQLEAVFEPFLRLETSRSRESGGTGLGLTIARRMANATGATLVLRNGPEGGLQAILTLAPGPA